MPSNEIKIIIEAIDKTKEAFKEVESNFQRLTSSLKANYLQIAAAAATLYGAKRLIFDTAKDIASQANEIERQSQVLGISTNEFQKWQYAAKMADVNAQEFNIGLKMLSRNMEDAASESGDTAKYFSAMGVSVKTADGHLRPLNDVMGDVMDKFATWEDGPRKIAISMQLFGRSGETLIPLLNKGKTGFNELATEAQKLGIILSPELIRKGSEAEDIFKRLEEQSKKTKLSLTPLALEFAKTIESILGDFNKLNDWLKANKTTDWFPQLKELNEWLRDNSIDQWLSKIGIYTKRFEEQEAQRIAELGEPDWVKKWVKDQYRKPPSIIDEEKRFQELLKKNERYFQQLEKIAEAERNMPTVEEVWRQGIKEKYIWLQNIQKELDEIGIKLKSVGEAAPWGDEEPLGLKPGEMRNELTGQVELIEDIVKWKEREKEIDKEILDLEIKLKSVGEAIGWGAEEPIGLKPGEMMIGGKIFNISEYEQSIKDLENILKEFGQTISSSFGSAMSEIILQGKSVGEALKQIWADIASYVIKKISEMLINYLLFQDAIKGYQGFQSGKGLLGWIASIFGYSEGGIIPGFKPIPSFAGGSLVYRPTLGIIGDSPEGPEAVIPLKGGKVPVEMMGQTSDQPNVVNYYVTNNYIDAVDLESFEKKYVPTVVGSLGKIKYRGTMKSLMRKNR